MASLSEEKFEVVGALALSMLCLIMTAASAAQTGPTAPSGAVLESKAATRLLIDEVKPDYPALAKVNYIQGSVRLLLRVTREGRVAEVHVVHGHPFLAEAALQAARRWVYRPLKKGSQALEFTTFVDVRFALHTRKIEQLPPTPEKDLDRQVQPPVLLGSLPEEPPADLVRMRVLVGPKGHALDSEPLSGPPAGFDAARKRIEHSAFRPAQWGNHAVPWYLDVDVPVGDMPFADGSGDPPRR